MVNHTMVSLVGNSSCCDVFQNPFRLQKLRTTALNKGQPIRQSGLPEHARVHVGATGEGGGGGAEVCAFIWHFALA
jgi:hypothetical protein